MGCDLEIGLPLELALHQDVEIVRPPILVVDYFVCTVNLLVKCLCDLLPLVLRNGRELFYAV